MIPVILAGGSGSRLWPVSRRAFPKPLAPLVGEALLATTVRRLRPLGEPWLVTTAATRSPTLRLADELGLAAERTVFEPDGRDTAPAVALVCHLLQQAGHGDEVAGVFPADHLIEDEAGFRRACRLAARCAAAEPHPVVTLGIRPTAPATGYGYVETTGEVLLREEVGETGRAGDDQGAAGSRAETASAEGVAVQGDDGLAAYAVRAFHEKPDAATARRYFEAGGFYWNAGMFVFTVDRMARAFAELMPALWERIRRLRLDRSNLAEVYAEVERESLDYGVMEHLAEQATVPCAIGWSDLGSWDEVARHVAPAAAAVYEIGGGGNFVHPHRDRLYGLVGVQDLLVVDTADALLVVHKGRSQEVKELVAALESDRRPEAREHPYEHRPWGSFEVLRDEEDFKSKVLRVSPGHQLSYQSHRHRAEHWVIIRGHPEVVLDGEVLRPEPGEAVYVPRGAKHRIRNPGDEEVELVEVQVGDSFAEDDIVRYEDDYDRAGDD